jgi:hypothetical protein
MDKKNIILAISLASLALVAIFINAPQKSGSGPSAPNILAVKDLAQADEISIASSGNVIGLKKEGERWKISGTKNFYADQDKVARLLDALTKAGEEDLELVSVSSSKRAQLLPERTAAKITIKASGATKLDAIAARATTRPGNYLGLAGKNETYSSKTDIASLALSNEWADLEIFSGNKDDINRVRFQYPGSEFSVEKKDGQWSGIKPFIFPVSPSKIDEILDIMTNLQSVKMPAQDFKGTGLEKNLIIVQATGSNISHTIMVGEADKDGNYFAKRGDSDNIYLITKKQRDELSKKINDLK